MPNVFVKPVLIDGKPAIVPDPVTRKPLAAGGEWKPQNQYWLRRVAQGDVIDATADQTAAQAQQKPGPTLGPSPVPPAPAAQASSGSKSKSAS
jgi:hypothetical protein